MHEIHGEEKTMSDTESISAMLRRQRELDGRDA